MVPRYNLHISLGRLFAPFGSPGKYFFKFAHPSKFECVVSLHTLQGSFFFSSGVCPPLVVDPLFLFGPLFLGLFLFLVLSSWKGARLLQGSGQSKEELCANCTSHGPNWTKIAPNDQ